MQPLHWLTWTEVATLKPNNLPAPFQPTGAVDLMPVPPPRLLPLLGWMTGAVFFFYAWVLRVAPSIMVDELMRDLSVGAAVLGNLSAAYFYGYAGMQIPGGMLLDRFGPRRLVTVAALVCAGGTVMFALGQSLAVVTTGRFLIGAAAAFSFIAAMKVASQWFPPHRFALLTGFAMAAGMAGGVVGQAPLRMAVEATDWRTATLWIALGGVVISLCAWCFMRDKELGTGGIKQVFSGLAEAIRDRQVLLLSLAGLGANGALLGFAGLWGVPFLVIAYDIERTTAATLISLLIAGWGIGAPMIGWLSDRVGSRKWPYVIGISVECIALALIIWAPALPLTLVGLLAFITGFAGSSMITSFALVRERVRPALTGTAIGFLNGMVTGAGALFQPLIGFILDLLWRGQSNAGSRVYDVLDYRISLSVLIVFCVIGLIALMMARETPHARPDSSTSP